MVPGRELEWLYSTLIWKTASCTNSRRQGRGHTELAKAQKKCITAMADIFLHEPMTARSQEVVPKKQRRKSGGPFAWSGFCCFFVSLMTQANGAGALAQVKNPYGNDEAAKCYSYSSAEMIQWCLNSYEKHLLRVLEQQEQCLKILQSGGANLPSYCRK